jgi:hypothetical protein
MGIWTAVINRMGCPVVVGVFGRGGFVSGVGGWCIVVRRQSRAPALCFLREVGDLGGSPT